MPSLAHNLAKSQEKKGENEKMLGEEKIIEAVKTIKEVCIEHKHCEDCPYYTSFHGCNITRPNPKDWEIVKSQPLKVFL